LRAGETGGGPTAGVIRHGADLVETNDGGSVKRSARPGTKAIWFTWGSVRTHSYRGPAS
jgi:hypothetical protein